MIKEILQAIEGVEIFQVVSLFVFIALFVGVIVHALRISPGEIEHASCLPLDDGVEGERAEMTVETENDDD